MASLSASRGVAPAVSSSSYKQQQGPLWAPTSAATRAQQQPRRRKRDACSVVAMQAAIDAASSTTTTTTTTASTPSPPSPLPSSPPLPYRSLIGMPLEELEDFVESELGEPRARARQLFRWLYCSGGARVGTAAAAEEESLQTPPSPSPSSRSDAPGPETAGGFSSAFLAKVSPFPSLLDPGIELVGVRRSADGTRKLLFLLTEGPARGKVVDAVLIPSAPSCSIPSSSSSSPSSPSSSAPPPRLTLCVSSQAGCAMGCAFCLTGAQGLSGSLSSAQIVGQLVAARQLLRREQEEEEEEEGGKGRAGAGAAAGGGYITNVVFMGQGEPLDNLDAVVASVRVMTDPRAGSMSSGGGNSGGGGDVSSPAAPSPRQWSLSPNRVTVSTVGLVPQLRSLVALCDAQVALSLHAASEGTRRGIVPATARHGTEELRQALEELFPRRRRRGRRTADGDEEADASSSSAATAATTASPGRGKRRHVLIEMTLLSGVNDSDDDARLLLKFLSEIEAKVNLIPWNPHPGSPFSPPSAARVEAFKRVVQWGDDDGSGGSGGNGGGGGEKRVCTVRMARGADEAMAACGQLGEVGLVPRAARARIVEEVKRDGGSGAV